MIKNSLMKSFVLVIAFLLPATLFAGNSVPEQLIKATTSEVLEEIKKRQNDFKQDPAKLYAMVDEKVLPNFDFNRMTDLALGRYKRKVKDAERIELVSAFRALLVRTYGKALLEYTDQVIHYLPMRGSIDKGEVTIRTEVEQKGGFPIPINYELYELDGVWKVFDISIDNISLVTNYRSSFAREIKSDGVAALIKKLNDRNKEEK